MRMQAHMHKMLDGPVLEARTQAIGRELFAAARREHAHLSVLNRWTAQVLAWCLADPDLKSRVLRFIDVLPSLTTPQAVARHVRDYFGEATLRLPRALRLGSSIARAGLLTAPALSRVVRQLVEEVGRQFIAEATPEGARRIAHELAAHQAACSLDLLGEQVLSEAEADAYAAQSHVLLNQLSAAYASLPHPLATCGPAVHLSIKPSALTPRFDPISPKDSVARAMRRLQPILHRAEELDAHVTLDMEQYELRDLTLALAKRCLEETQASLGIVIQAYLRDAEEVVEELLAWLATRRRHLTVRLVKGAYWDSEVAQAMQHHWPIPVHEDKAATDRAFESLTRRLLAAHPLVTTAIASHNARSIAHAMAVIEALDLEPHQAEFQLLYGMGEALQGAIIAQGYPVRIYTPVGALIPGMAYLVRRLLENTANESFLRQDFRDERGADDLLAPPVVTTGVRSRPSEPEPGEPFLDVSRARDRDRMTQALLQVRGQMGRSYGLLLGDELVETPATLTIRNPSSPDEIVGVVACAGLREAYEAVRCATEAQRSWGRVRVSERVGLLRRVAAMVRDRRAELAAWEVFEVGKTWREADADLVETIDYLEYYSRQMLELAEGRPLQQAPGEANRYVYVPKGVAVVIAPWNFPAAILTGMASAALAAGNAVILKPAEQSPVIAAHLAQIFREAGVPPGVVQYLPGTGEDIGAALVRHPEVQVILFTGSKAVGLSILQAASTVPPGQRCIKHVVAEMGGKNAIIVDADADLDRAVQGILRSAFGYSGQKCSAASRLIVHEAVADRCLARLAAAADRLVLGDPADPATDLGPLIDAQAKRRLEEAIARAQRVGAVRYQYPADRVPPAGHFVGPAIVEVPADDPLAREELFGPLLCVFRARSFHAALALANDTNYALTGGVYSRSPSHLAQAARDFDVGNLYLNRPITGALVGRQPFGGHRLSGLGTKAGGPDYLLQLLTPKTICTDTTRHGMPLA